MKYRKLRKNKRFSPILSLGCQGDVKAALLLIKKVRKAKLTDLERLFTKEFLDRFEKRKPENYRCSDPVIKGVIDLYQRYWLSVLLGEQSLTSGEKWLFAEVASFVSGNGIQFKSKFDDKYYCKRLKSVIEARGYKCIVGTVVPIQELELWREEEVVSYKVRLPASTQTVKTTFLKNFIVCGWMDFATLGVYYPGGWATKQGLYCISSSYNRNSEKFKVSYLGHEAQHFSDYKSGENGEVFHKETSMIAPSLEEKLVVWNFNNNTPGLTAHELKSIEKRNESTLARFCFGDLENSSQFREQLDLEVFEDGDIKYAYYWGLPGGELHPLVGRPKQHENTIISP